MPIAGILGAIFQSNAAGNAANVQAGAANNAAELQYQSAQNALNFEKQVYGNTQAQIAPYLAAGTGALGNLSYLLGVNPASIPQTGSFTGNTSTGGPQGIPGGVPSGTYTGGAFQPGQPIAFNDLRGRTSPTTGGFVSPQTVTNPATQAGGAFGSLMQPWNTPFTAPTNVTEQNDPGFQFRLLQGQQALERSAAARGGLLSGGTAKALTQYGQDYASNEYQNVYNRALGEYQQAYNIFQQNQANQYNRLASLAGVGQTAAGQLAGAGQSAAGQNANILLGSSQNIGQAIQNAGAATASGYAAQGNIWGNALNNLGGNVSDLAMLGALGGA